MAGKYDGVSSGTLVERLNDLTSKVDAVNSRLGQAQRDLTELQGEAATLDAERRSIRGILEARNRPAPSPEISDHALIRFIERAHNIDIEMLRERILSPTVVKAIAAGASRVVVDGVVMIIRDNRIVTVLGDRHVRKVRRGVKERGDEIERGLQDYYENQE